MEKFVQEATIDNVLESIKQNNFNRNKDIRDFIESLDMITENAFISLDARWGEGKTYYVRQIEQTLKYLTRKKWNLPVNELEEYFSDISILNSIDLNYSYLPIYYNAWLYDNHDDPLMSLLLVMVKECQSYLDTKIDSTSVGEKMCSLLDAFTFSIKNIELSINTKSIKEAISGKDILSSVKTAEQIREMVKSVFEGVIVENAQKLVIFIDELDRCRPDFAIEMLERIKHYFDDDRIIFVISINKEQLIHTVSKFYGINFDSTGYLNKFFDLNIYLPVIDPYVQNRIYLNSNQVQYFVEKISEELNSYYKLSLRDALIFKQHLMNLPVSYVNDYSGQGCVLSVFVPIIIILDIIDETEKTRFLRGESKTLLKDLFKNILALQKVAYKFSIDGRESDEGFQEGYMLFEEAYDYIFGTKQEENFKGKLDLNRDIKQICIQICNGFLKDK
ncbi:KAP family P-loop NTPase fold protein [Frisingicoccus sp.]|uniref:KAP family P-loop NTPase fold protein n=1 Tax=Frisingicoccus sp. TaxID=1918627 RepID=UPI003AB3FE04